MHRFVYKNNQLYCEGASVADIAARHKTPFYLYSQRTFADHYLKIKTAFGSMKPLICFSVKANSNLAVLKTLVKRGAGLDIVSGGELYKALKVGCHPKKIVYASVGKRPEEIKDAIRSEILFFNVESVEELSMVNGIAASLRKKPLAAVRINPDISAKTHDYVATGKSESKFGVDFGTAETIFKSPEKFPSVKLAGLHIHIGSQITEPAPFIGAIRKVLNFVDASGIHIEWLNIGGGLGIVYGDEKPQTAESFAEKILPLLKGRTFRLILEPGRFIAGNSGILVTRILYIKETPHGKKFAVVDAGMNDLIRPSLYGAYHQILPVFRRLNVKPARYDVVGPICESGDFLALDRKIQTLKAGDLLAVMSAGAYGYVMASNYNSRCRPAEIMVVKNKVYTVKRPETYRHLIRGEIIPKTL